MSDLYRDCFSTMRTDIRDFVAAQQLGEGNAVEFKRCGNGVEHDVFESVCSFANRFGGDIYLGVLDDGSVAGVNKASCETMIRNIVNTVNNPNVIRPSVYVEVDSFEVDDRRVIRIHVPVSGNVHTFKGEYYDRRGDADVKVLSNEQIADMFIRKRDVYTERKVFPSVTIDDLRMDMLPTLRQEAQNKLDAGRIHPWSKLDDFELLKSAGLYGEDPTTKEKGFNLAAILLIGKDSTIMNHCPQYQTDALYRVVNVDRYDDRLLLKTNLLESYEQLMEFASAHLPDPFYLEKDKRISLRNILTREMISNILTHREFTSSAASQFVIERDRMFTVNPCRAFRDGTLGCGDITPRPKNPIIAGFFREVGFVDQLGSGVKNLYRYAKDYGGSDPVISEGDVFSISVSLKALDPIRFAFGRLDGEKVSIDEGKVAVDSLKVSVGEEKVSIDRRLNGLDLTAPTRANILKLYQSLAAGEVFGRSRIMHVTGLGISGSGKFLNTMLKLKLLESVVGHGKGKYRFRSCMTNGEV